MLIGKLRLLDAGCLLEATELEAVMSQRDPQVGSEEDEPASAKLDEAALLAKISEYVDRLLASKPTDGTGRSLGLVAEHRRKLIGEFMKRQGASTLCQGCRAHIPNLHRHGNAKIFQTPLRKNLQAAMDAKALSSKLEDEERSEDEADVAAEEEDEEVPEDAGVTRGMKYMTPLHVYEHLKALWRNERPVLDLVFNSNALTAGAKRLIRGQRPEATPGSQQQDHRIFFTEVIAVPPCRFRPPSVFGESSFDHPQNTYLTEIIRLGQRLIEIRQQCKLQDDGLTKDKLAAEAVVNATEFARLVETWSQLQLQVNYFYDSSSNTSGGGGKLPPAGIKQILEKKEGLFRKHMYELMFIYVYLLMRVRAVGWERESTLRPAL